LIRGGNRFSEEIMLPRKPDRDDKVEDKSSRSETPEIQPPVKIFQKP